MAVQKCIYPPKISTPLGHCVAAVVDALRRGRAWLGPAARCRGWHRLGQKPSRALKCAHIHQKCS